MYPCAMSLLVSGCQRYTKTGNPAGKGVHVQVVLMEDRRNFLVAEALRGDPSTAGLPLQQQDQVLCSFLAGSSTRVGTCICCRACSSSSAMHLGWQHSAELL